MAFDSQMLRKRLADIDEELKVLSSADEVTQNELDEKIAQRGLVESRMRASEIVEGGSGGGAVSELVPTVEHAVEPADAEAQERAALLEKASITNYMAAALRGGEVRGAEHELSAAFEVGAGQGGARMPWQLLMPVEERVDAVTALSANNQANNNAWLARVFSQTSGSFLGVSFASVPAGQANYSVLTAGATTTTPAKEAAGDATEATMSVVTLAPNRMQARLAITREDRARIVGLESTLQEDLRAQLNRSVDEQIFKRATNGLNARLPSAAGTRTQVTLANGVATQSNFRGGFVNSDVLDGTYAAALSDVKMAVNTDNFPTFYTEVSAIRDYWINGLAGPGVGLGVRSTTDIPSASATNRPFAILSKANGLPNSAVFAAWQGIELTVDNLTKLSEGIINMQADMLFDFKVIRTNNWHALVQA